MTNLPHPIKKTPSSFDFTVLNNIPMLLSFEQKNFAILMLARHKISTYVRISKTDDPFILELNTLLQNNVADFREIDILFTAFDNSKAGTNMHFQLFKLVKPLEEIAVYLSEIATIDSAINWKENEDNLVPFVLYSLDYWFRVLGKHTNHFTKIYEFKYQDKLSEIQSKYLKKNIGYPSEEELAKFKIDKDKLHNIFDKSEEICESLSSYTYRPLININSKRNTKKIPKRKRK